MNYEYLSYDVALEKLYRLEKLYSSLMKQSFDAAIKNRLYSDKLNEKALNIKKEILNIRSGMLATA
jgi:hypothetical protein